MLRRIMRHDWRNLRADYTLPFVVLLLITLTGYGLFSGVAWSRSYQASIDGLHEQSAKRLAQLKERLGDAEKQESPPKNLAALSNPFRPAVATQHVVLPPAPLIALAVGQGDIMPNRAQITVWSGARPFTGNHDLQSPINLLTGRFDLAFVIIYLYPLIILTLSYNILSTERELGTLAMLLAQPVKLRTLVLGKIALRAIVVLALSLGLALLGVGLSGVGLTAEGSWLRLVLWAALVIAYSVFWFSLAIAVNAWGKSSATNAITLVALWLGLVLIAPAMVNVLVTAAHPVPSRVEMMTASRDVSIDARRDGSKLLASYYEDHPELAPSSSADDLSDFNIRALLVIQETQRLVEPVAARYDEQLRKQQVMVNRWRFVSPAIVMREAINDVAGASVTRYQHFRAQAESFSADWRAHFAPFIFKRIKFTSADYERLPRFVYQEEPLRQVASRTSAGLIGLLAPALIIGMVGAYFLKRYPIAG